MITSMTVPQKADSPGERRSTIRHHTSTTTGSRKCRPESSTARVLGSSVSGWSGSSAGSGALLAAIFSRPR
ncbi:hypothetical protein D3C77_596080 [compost metagenome]